MKTLNKVNDKIEDAYKRAFNKRVIKKIALDLVKQIVKRTKLGYGVAPNSDKQQKLKPLSPKYKEWRKKNKDQLHSTASPSKSNLTLTGDMLKNIEVKIEGDTIILYFGKEFDRMKAVWNTRSGRPFFALTKGEQNQLRETIRELLLKELKE